MDVRHLLRRLGGSSGQSTVEFAFLVPLICVLLLLSVDLGRAALSWLDATHLANMGARAAAVASWPTKASGESLQQWIRSEAIGTDMRGQESTSSIPSAATVCVDFPDGTSNVGDPVQITVAVDYHVISVPFMDFEGPTWTLRGSSTMRLEQQPSYAAGCTS